MVSSARNIKTTLIKKSREPAQPVRKEIFHTTLHLKLIKIREFAGLNDIKTPPSLVLYSLNVPFVG